MQTIKPPANHASPWTWIAILLVTACGDGAVPIDEIDPNKRIIDLADPEVDGLCEWASGVFAEKARCNGLAIENTGCQTPSNPQCVATVEHYMQCFPGFVERVDWCRFTIQALSGELVEIATSVPGCEDMGPCVEVMIQIGP